MRAIIVDDERIMLNSFLREAESIPDLEIAGSFTQPEDALEYIDQDPVELAFLDVRMPGMNGIELAGKLMEKNPGIVIVFITAYDEYIRDSNRIGGDYYIVKPYKTETLEKAMEKIRLIAHRQKKDVRVRTFGTFSVLKNGRPVALRGKAKEILAFIVTRRGKEVSNKEIYRVIWEDRSYSNENMTVYYNALRRLKKALVSEGLSNILISTARGQMVNTNVFDCDYYEWMDGRETKEEAFEGEFLSEYSWGEFILGGMVSKYTEL